MGNCCTTLNNNRRHSLRSYKVAPENGVAKVLTVQPDPSLPQVGTSPPPLSREDRGQQDNRSAASWDESLRPPYRRPDSDSMRCELGSVYVVSGAEVDRPECPLAATANNFLNVPGLTGKPRAPSPASSSEESFWIPGSLARHMGYFKAEERRMSSSTQPNGDTNLGYAPESGQHPVNQTAMDLYDHPRSLLKSMTNYGIENENFNHREPEPGRNSFTEERNITENKLEPQVSTDSLQPKLKISNTPSPMLSSIKRFPRLSFPSPPRGGESQDDSVELMSMASYSSEDEEEDTQQIYTLDKDSMEQRDSLVLLQKVKVSSKKSLDSNENISVLESFTVEPRRSIISVDGSPRCVNRLRSLPCDSRVPEYPPIKSPESSPRLEESRPASVQVPSAGSLDGSEPVFRIDSALPLSLQSMGQKSATASAMTLNLPEASSRPDSIAEVLSGSYGLDSAALAIQESITSPDNSTRLESPQPASTRELYKPVTIQPNEILNLSSPSLPKTRRSSKSVESIPRLESEESQYRDLSDSSIDDKAVELPSKQLEKFDPFDKNVLRHESIEVSNTQNPKVNADPRLSCSLNSSESIAVLSRYSVDSCDSNPTYPSLPEPSRLSTDPVLSSSIQSCLATSSPARLSRDPVQSGSISSVPVASSPSRLSGVPVQSGSIRSVPAASSPSRLSGVPVQSGSVQSGLSSRSSVRLPGDLVQSGSVQSGLSSSSSVRLPGDFVQSGSVQFGLTAGSPVRLRDRSRTNPDSLDPRTRGKDRVTRLKEDEVQEDNEDKKRSSLHMYVEDIVES